MVPFKTTSLKVSADAVIGSGLTVTGNISASDVVYASGGNSNLWNSAYTTVLANSATTWNYQGTDLKALSGNWQNTYTNVQSNSSNWNDAYNTGTVYQANSASYATNTTLESVSSILTPLTLTNTLTSQLVLNTDFNSYKTNVAAATATLLPTTIYQNASGFWNKNYIYVNTNTNLSSNYKYTIDTLLGPLTAVLPASPNFGDEIEVFDVKGAWSTNNLVLDSNGNYIEQRLDTLGCNVRFGLIKLIYTDNNIGWRIIPFPRHDILPILAPDVSIQVNALSGSTPLTINFTGVNNLGEEIAPVSTWTWNVTGGNTPQFTTQNTTFTYQTSGTYTVNLTAANSIGTDTASITISATTASIPTSDLLVRFNADSGVTESGGNITSWTDQQNGVVATAFNSPTLLTNAFNGRKAVSLDGINEYFTGNFGTQININTGRTFVIIGKYNSMTGQTGIFDGSTDLQAYIFQSGGSLYYNNIPQIGPVTGNFTANYFIQIINTSDASGSTTFRVNGVDRVTGNMGRPQMTGFNIGRRGNKYEYANFNLVELLVYNRSLTLAEMQQIETYANI